MKRRLITTLCVSLTVLAACQTEPLETGTAEPLTASCGAQMPATPFWNGEALPKAGGKQIYLLYPDLARVGEWVLVLVDYGQDTIPFGRRTKDGTVGVLLSKLDLASAFVGGRQPSPPNPVGDWELPAALIEWARLAAPDRAEAEFAGVCKL